MRKDLLRRVNFIFYLLLTAVFAALQSTVFSYYPLHYLQPDLTLILIVYFGFKRSVVEGSLFLILASTILECSSSAGNHFFLTTYMYAYVIATLLSRTVVVPDFFSSIGIVAGLTVLKKIGLLVLLGMAGKAENGLKHFLIYLIPGIIVQSVLTPVCFMIFQFIDLKTYKDEHAEDEYDINKGL